MDVSTDAVGTVTGTRSYEGYTNIRSEGSPTWLPPPKWLLPPTPAGREDSGDPSAQDPGGSKLGFIRLGFNYFISEEAFEYILEAVHFVANHGWRLLPLYRFNPASGLWRQPRAPSAPTLADAAIPRVSTDHALAHNLEEARLLVQTVQAASPSLPVSDPVIGEAFEQIRWFPLPGEALARLRGTHAA